MLGFFGMRMISVVRAGQDPHLSRPLVCLHYCMEECVFGKITRYIYIYIYMCVCVCVPPVKCRRTRIH